MSRIIAGGSAGNWFFVGYITLIAVGCGGILACGTVQHVLSTILNKKPNNLFSWIGLIVWEIGIIGSTLLLGLAGFIGGSGLLDGLATSAIHEKIVIYALPVEILIFIAIIGFFISIINIYTSSQQK
jgi:hypothetical protein